MENTVISITKSKNSFFWSIAFFTLVVLLTLSLFIYNVVLVNQNAALETKISESNQTILSIENDDAFKVFSLIEANKETLQGLISRSNVTKYMNHMQNIMDKYGLSFRWFWISGLNLKTSISTTSDTKLAYKKVVSFIKDYRNDKDALFNLNFINKVSWYNDMKIDLNFEIK